MFYILLNNNNNNDGGNVVMISFGEQRETVCRFRNKFSNQIAQLLQVIKYKQTKTIRKTKKFSSFTTFSQFQYFYFLFILFENYSNPYFSKCIDIFCLVNIEKFLAVHYYTAISAKTLNTKHFGIEFLKPKLFESIFGVSIPKCQIIYQQIWNVNEIDKILKNFFYF